MAAKTTTRRRVKTQGKSFWGVGRIGLALAGLVALYAAYELWRLPSGSEISALRTEAPRETALMRQRKAEAQEAGRKLKIWCQPVGLSQIPPSVTAAVVASEDARFFEHEGLDFKQIDIAVREKVKQGRSLRGASTLTQQLAKNLWLSTDRSLVRKLKEALLASRLENHLSKKRILELYLNAVEWGEGVFGIQAAAETHFHKNARELTLAESAALAALLPSPRKLPHLKSAWYQRARHVLDRIGEEHLAPAEMIQSARLELAIDFGQAPPKPTEPPAPEPDEIEDAHAEPDVVEPPPVPTAQAPAVPDDAQAPNAGEQ